MNPIVPRSQQQIEMDLQPILHLIKKEKASHLSLKNITHLTLKEFKKDAKKYPWGTTIKIMGLIATGALLHPLVLGSIACLNIYRLEDWNDLYSPDIDTANTATQLYTNLGHGVGYLIESVELTLIASACILRNCYLKATARQISKIYNKYIDQAHTIDEQNFLWELKKNELLQYGYAFVTAPKPNMNDQLEFNPV